MKEIFKILILLTFLLNILSFHKVSVYYGNWKAYERDFPLCAVPFDKIDRLFYVFTDPTSGKCKLADDWLDLNKPGPIDGKCSSQIQPETDALKGNMYQLKVIKERYPKLKVFLVIGGYEYSEYMNPYIMTNDTAKMSEFVKSCVEIYHNYSYAFDGVDIDYEYPCLYEDLNCAGSIVPAFNERKLFVDFIMEFKKQLGDLPLISIATSASSEKIKALDFAKLDKIVDIYNIMTYDFTAGSQGDDFTGHQTQPKTNPDDPINDRKSLSSELASSYFIENGASKDKINIGVAFYARGFKIQSNLQIKTPFQLSLGGIGFGTWYTGVIEYYDLKENYMNSTNVYFDEEASAPYIVDSINGTFFSFDDERSIEKKLGLVYENGYEGIFAYELTGDDENFTLLNAMTGEHYLKYVINEGKKILAGFWVLCLISVLGMF